uniref:Non-structural maintenance of chromosomes element 4 n=1 Tax=Phallusia mammillata TaxID=59560 RepID=A0A6F9DMN7_9ASCI|nr:non-structural maintenance of chromosomes element 4 homolog A [Phallusia mammillata]
MEIEGDCSANFGDSVLSQPTYSGTQQSKEEKVEIRKNYRRLIEETQQNKEDLVKPQNNGLIENIKKAHQLFQNVQGTREGALDSRFMSLAVSLGAQKTNLLQTDLIAFQPDEFVQKLITMMEGRVAADDPEDVTIPESGWDTLGKMATLHFRSLVPALHPLLGTFDPNATPKPKTNRNKQNDEAQGKTQLPQHLTNFRVDQKEATPEEIERVLKIVRGFYSDDPTPIDYFELVVNPDSYSHTIENLFHLSFLVKDGLVRVFLNDNGIPVVEPTADRSTKKNSNKTPQKACNQIMVSMSMDEWEQVIDAYQLKGKPPYIPPSVISKK